MSKNKDFYIVGIGASAGGLDAIQLLFDHIPDETGLAFVIVQHLSPDFKSLMPELLAKHTGMKIFTAEDGLEINPNCIYLNERNKNLIIRDKKLFLSNKLPKGNLNLPIDVFFHTLGDEFKDKSVGVILSGTGSDGSRGIKTIKETGGTVIVQEPGSAQFDGMPNMGIATRLADFILIPQKIGEVLIKTTEQKLDLDFSDSKTQPDELYLDILEEIYKSTGINFGQYKSNTLLRRLEKRMNINNADSLHEYLSVLKSNPAEKESIKNDFLIGVTSFFRDPQAFESLKTKVIPEITARKKEKEVIRIWVAGCSSGEEVFSIAMLVEDQIQTRQLDIDYKIFATDVDTEALNSASRGSYHLNIGNEMEKYYLDNYFIRSGDSWQIVKKIREKIVFSYHNLLKDPPFIRMDLIVCRNLLIYLKNPIQKKVLLNFQFALNRYGYLFLGSSESLGEVAKYFKITDGKWKVFQNTSEAKHIPSHTGKEDVIRSLVYHAPEQNINQIQYRYKENPENTFHKYLSRKYSPSIIFTDKDFNVLFLKGDIVNRLKFSEGVYQNNLIKMLEPSIASMIKNGVSNLSKNNKDVLLKDVVFWSENKKFQLDLMIHRPENDELAELIMIQFGQEREIEGEFTVLKREEPDESSIIRLNELESELKATRSELQNVVEELETSNEELQSSNEELMASNEELQSTNEELQSVNEELYTVNSELQEKNRELQLLNNDVTNLLDSTEIGTLFLDNELRIRKFTPALTKHFRLHDSDIGRPIASFASNFDERIRKSIIADSKTALENFKSIERELEDYEGRFYLKRVSPFVTADKKIDGVVITFVEITDLKSKEKSLWEANQRFEMASKATGIAFWEWYPEENRTIGNKNWNELFGFSGNEKNNSQWLKNIHSDDRGKIASMLDAHFHGETEGFDVEFRYNHPLSGKEIWMQSIGKVVERDSNSKAVKVSGLSLDITEEKQTKEELVKTEKMYRGIIENAPDGVVIVNFEGEFVFIGNSALKMFGYDRKVLPEKNPSDLTHPDDLPRVNKVIESLVSGKTQFFPALEYRFQKADGKYTWIESTFSLSEDIDGNPAIVINFRNIEDRKAYEKELIEAKKHAELANFHKNYFLANMSHEIRTPMHGVIGFSDLLKKEGLSNEERKNYLDIIDGNAKQLLNLIDDIIDVAKIESDELNIVKKECCPEKFLRDLESNFNQLKIAADKADLIFECCIPEESRGLKINTDCLRLRQVVSNLLNNAMKFSDSGTISFGYELIDKEIHFFVKDEGMGIASEKQKEIFERFKQINYQDAAKYGGTGLGLTISRGIVNLLGGDISVSSELNKGTVFRFFLPLEISEETVGEKDGIEVVPEVLLKGKTIMIVDDEEKVRYYFNEVLKSEGCNLIFAENGEKAIQMYHQNTVDLTLMDIRMPQMDGFKAIKEILKIDPEAKIIAQSAYAMQQEKQKSLELGCSDYLSKPIAYKDLIKALHMAFS